MAILRIRVRGIFTVVLREDDEGNKSARILFPNGLFPQFATGNIEQRIMPYFPYVAVPMARCDGTTTLPGASIDEDPYQPNLICPIKLDDHPDAPPSLPLGSGLLREMVHVIERVRPGLSDTEGELYAIYFAPQHEIRVKGVASWPSGMIWDDRDVDFSTWEPGKPLPYPKSMKWGKDLEELKRFDPQLISDPDPDRDAVAAFVDFTAGEIVPKHDKLDPRDGHIHIWRFMHSGTLKKRPMPDGVDLTLPLDCAPKLVLRQRTENGEILTIPLDPDAGPIFIGNEPIDDLLRVAPIQSCADPIYPFELTYQLCDGDLSTLPIPVCADPRDYHRDPPETRCSPLTVVRPGIRSKSTSSSGLSREALTGGSPIGFAVHLGVNDYARNGPSFTVPDLQSAIFDAQGFAELTTARGFRHSSKGAVLTDKDVKNWNIMEVIAEAGAILKAGDYFVITFAGYGYNNGIRGWQLFRKFIAFEALYQALSTLPDDVRVLVVSAACYSGRLTEAAERKLVRELPMDQLQALWDAREEKTEDGDDDFNLLSAADVHANVSFFEKIRLNRPVIVHLAACGARQTIPDGPNATTHSDFVRRCLGVATERRSFAQFEKRLQDASPSNQRPEIDKPPDLPPAYEQTGPFRIE